MNTFYIQKKVIKLFMMNHIFRLGFWIFQNEIWRFRETYWSQFSIRQWIESLTLVCYLKSQPDVINGTTWFLIPLFMFYLLCILYGLFYRKLEWKSAYIMEAVVAVVMLFLHWSNANISQQLIFVFMPISDLLLAELLKTKNEEKKKLHLCGLLTINYLQMIIAFRRFYPQY